MNGLLLRFEIEIEKSEILKIVASLVVTIDFRTRNIQKKYEIKTEKKKTECRENVY